MSAPGREVWLRGPVEGVPPLLQPVAHGLMQAAEEVATILEEFPDDLLWMRPAGVASVGFHLQHLVGVIDRLFNYTRGELLAPAQLDSMRQEGTPRPGGETGRELVAAFQKKVEWAVDVLRSMDEATLTEPREVGRARLPSTVIGLLFHATEHSQRHVGQLLVTARVLRA